MILLISIVVFSNISAQSVRAETFGQESILYELVAQDDSVKLETVQASIESVNVTGNSRYLSDSVLDARAHIDIDFFQEQYVTTETGEQEPPTERVIAKREQIEVYTVQDGDTLGKIADSYGLNLSTLLWSNNLTFRSTIRPGDEIKILPTDGVLYTVRSGDTLSRIARNYGVEVGTIMSENALPTADRLSIGDELLIPGGEPPTPTAIRRTASVATLFSTAPTAQSSGWVWPTDWRVITQYYGWRHTGLDVDGDYSTYSYASRDGVVIYSGWRGGYGVTVEVDHGDGYVTRYAHHSSNLVSVGQVVGAGQALARTGSTGRSTGTHLHFEIIKNGRFQNPLDYIR